MELDVEQMEMIESMTKEAWAKEVAQEGDEAIWFPKAIISFPKHVALVAIVLPPNTHISQGIEVMGESLLNASVQWIAVVSDTRYTTDEKIYNSGERLQELAAKGVDGIGHAIAIYAVSRTGTALMSILPYEVFGNEVTWLEDECCVHSVDASGETAGGEMGVEGVVPQAMKRALDESAFRPPRGRENGQ
jgi:hypothetical protein